MSPQRIFLTQKQIVNQVDVFFSAVTLWSATACESVDCALSVSLRFSAAWYNAILFVNHLFGNSFVNSVALYP